MGTLFRAQQSNSDTLPLSHTYTHSLSYKQMAKLNMSFNLPFMNLPGLMHAFKDGLQELEQLKECRDKEQLEKKLKDLEAGLMDGLSAFLDPTAFSMDPSVATNGRDLGID